MISLGDLLYEFKDRAKPGESEPEVLTLTERNGFVAQRERFNKRLAVENTSKYKLIGMFDIAFNPYLLWAGAIAQNRHWDKGIISPLYPTFRAREGVDPNYLIRLLLTEDMIARYDTIAYGSVPRKRRTSVDDFLALQVPDLPPLPEQRRIAAILDLADTLRTKRKTALEFVTELERSSFDTAFGDPSSNRYGLPLGSIGDLVDSARYGTSQKSVPDGDVPVLRMGNLTMNGQIDIADLKYMNLAPGEVDRYTVVSGDILFNRTNSAALVGKTAVYRGERRMAYAGYLVRLRLKGDNEPAYVAGYLNSRHGKAVLRNMCKSIVGMANINAKELQRIPILLASPQCQRTYARAVDAIERQRETLERDAQALDDLFSALQSRAFRGEL
ncbi:restriction endonuclease subunit S [Gordonia sp. N1V]|uniref:restriction endonuclease subunit S n=1 Tax=Gordonia sp. N1V TaxID=3034163 RepID=UPI0023E1E43B|nr:restriction endonuclease subunit S [Gordonia sp. N1V]MDF3284550.1 restriction endonuclease subunit S [Gordonia sp. N1V]